ncbi:FAD/NAD(P)-binding domain-containing protein [Hypoxylon sp. FL1857]|nr:FAD/NAD(P)-binding domain-containing protein [Hypoxylon sp. FL1857]
MSQGTIPDLPVLIIGAGVAGLTLAQGLRLRSIPFLLFERHPLRSSQGHRFRISKDGQTALNSVLSPQLQSLLRRTAPDGNSFEPRYVDAKKLSYPAPKPTPVDPVSMSVDRTWIRMLTSLDIQDAIEYEKELESYEIVGEQVRVNFTDGSVALGKLLVGADGLRSRVRKQLQPGRRLLHLDRHVLWGRTSLTEDLKGKLPEDLLSWCMYLDQETNVQMVVEPVTWSKSVRQESESRLPDFSDYIYWVVCTSSKSEPLPKTVDEKKAFLEEATKAWHPSLKLILDSATHDLSTCIPVLSSKPDIELRSARETGRITLTGDAAHAMSPMGGSGGDTAIRSAADLARTIAEEGITKDSLAGFEARMEARAKERIEHSFRGGQKFWRGKEWEEYGEADI